MSIKALILDLDGTVYLEGNPIGDVVDQLNRHHANGIYMQFLTNNTSVSKQQYVAKLQNLSLDFVGEEHIVTPVDAFLNFAADQPFGDCFYLLPEAVIDDIETRGGPAMETDHPDLILVGFDKELTYQKLRKASELINDGVAYALTHIDLACPTERGPIPDCGAIAALLQHTTGRDRKWHFGKPGQKLADIILAKLQRQGIGTDETILVGDRYYTDVALGNKMQVTTCHVQTGESNSLGSDDPDLHRPEYEYDNICSFLREHM